MRVWSSLRRVRLPHGCMRGLVALRVLACIVGLPVRFMSVRGFGLSDIFVQVFAILVICPSRSRRRAAFARLSALWDRCGGLQVFFVGSAHHETPGVG